MGKYDGGTIRGKKNGVRKSLRVITGGSEITDDVLRQLYSVEHRDKIVVYTTTLTAVRATLGACDTVMKLLDILRLKVQVRRQSLDSSLSLSSYSTTVRRRDSGVNHTSRRLEFEDTCMRVLQPSHLTEHSSTPYVSQVKDVYKSDQFARELARRKPGAEVPFVFVK